MSNLPNPTESPSRRRRRTGWRKRKATLAIGVAVALLIVGYTFDIFDAQGRDLLRKYAGIIINMGTQPPDWQEGVIGEKGHIPPPPTGQEPSATPANPATPIYQIYFTDPTCPPEEERHGGLDETIAADLLTAAAQVDVAAFDLDAEPIVQALIDLAGNGRTVRVVTDTDNADLSSIRRLRRNGISVVEDKRNGLMHNKFIVIDQKILWMGSLNYTSSGVYCNNNNLVRFASPELAANYVAEMDEMYIERSFGPSSPINTPHEKLVVQGIEIENYFAPERELELVNVIARTVVRAEEEILFMAFSFTNEEIGEAMLGRADAGVPLRGIFESTGADSESSYYPIMAAAGLPNVAVLRDANPYIMHHKVIIVDRQTVVLGSFNFSASANRSNDENIAVVHAAAFAAPFVAEFERLRAAEEHEGRQRQLTTC
ncbi:MAG: phospholipase D-like domain-containing protein [Caldilineaceae bacterium]